MQVSFCPITTFKGSFKNINLNDYVPDIDNNATKLISPKFEIKQAEDIPQKAPQIKEFYCADTSISLFEASKSDIKDVIPDNIKMLMSFHGVDIHNDLFMLTGSNAQNQRFVVFNCFFKDENTNTNCEQLYCLKSDNDELSELQKDLILIFNDKRNKQFFIDGAISNPLKNICEANSNPEDMFSSSIKAMAGISKERSFDDLIDNKGKVYPVIYSADGQYIRYRVIPLVF